MLAIQIFSPKPIDYTVTYEKKDKIPFGCYITRDLLPEIFSSAEIIDNKRSIFELYFENPDLIADHVIVSESFDPEPPDLEKLLEAVEDGSHAFISSNFFSYAFLDTLNLSLKRSNSFEFIMGNDSTVLNFSNPLIEKKLGYIFEKYLTPFYLDSFQSENTVVLGKNEVLNKVNFVEIRRGKGSFFIHTNPKVFTNYIMVNDKYQYAANALTYLNPKVLVWDEYYKPMRIWQTEMSPLRVLMKSTSFKMGYILLVILFFLYVFFESKRKQRYIEIVKPLPNISLHFITTISRLYLFHKDHKKMAIKKFTFFMDHIRSHYFIDFKKNEALVITEIAGKSGIGEEKITWIFNQYEIIKNSPQITDNQLFEFNKEIEGFYNKSL